MPRPPRTIPTAPVPLDDAALDAVIGGAAIVPADAGSGPDLPLPGGPPLIPDMG